MYWMNKQVRSYYYLGRKGTGKQFGLADNRSNEYLL